MKIGTRWCLMQSLQNPACPLQHAGRPGKKRGAMSQEPVTFDLRNVIDGTSRTMEIYTFLFLVAIIVTAVEVVRVWWVAPPFRLSRRAGNPSFLMTLAGSMHSLQRWSKCTLLGWGMFTSLRITDLSKLLPQVVLLSFLSRWHMLKRIEYLRHLAVRRSKNYRHPYFTCLDLSTQRR